MADDATYQVPLQRQQGGTNLSIGSTGTITVESGGAVNVSSGGLLAIATGGQFAVPVTTQTTTSGTITNFGLTTIGTTIACAYTLADPDRAGLRKTIICTVAGATTATQVVTTASTNVTILGSSNPVSVIARTLTFHEAGECVELISASTTAWMLVGNVGGLVTLST